MVMVNRMKQKILKYFDLFFLLFHIFFFFYLCSNVISGDMRDVSVFFILSIVLTLLLLKAIRIFKLEDKKLSFFIIEVISFVVFISNFDYYTYSIESFLGLVIALTSICIFCCNQFLIIIPIISAIGAFALPEYFFSYFQVVLFVCLTQLKKINVSNRVLKSNLIATIAMQIIAAVIRILITFEEYNIGTLNYFDGTVRIKCLLILLLLAGFVVYIHECIKKRNKATRVLVTCTMVLPFAGSLFMRDIHVYLSAFCMIGLLGFFLCGEESIENKWQIIKESYIKILALVFVFKAIIYLDADLVNEDAFTISVYYFDYFHFGLTQRTLMGTLFYLLFGYHIPEGKFYVLVTIVYMLAFIVLLCLIKQLYTSYKKSVCYDAHNKIAEVLFLTFLSSACVFSYLHPQLTYRLDIYSMCLALASVYVLFKNKFVFLVPLFCVLAILNHQVFVFIIFPIVFIAFVYRIFIEHEGHFKRNLIAFIVMVLAVVGLFSYLQFVSHANTLVSADEAIDIVIERSGGFFANEEYFDGESGIIPTVIFADAKTHTEVWQRRIGMTQVMGVIKLLIYSSPLIAVCFYAFFVSAAKEKNGFKKFIYYAMPFSVVAFLPVYILETDYGRWNQHLMAFFLMELIVITIMQKVEEKWYKALPVKKQLLLISLLYLLMVMKPLFTRAV